MGECQTYSLVKLAGSSLSVLLAFPLGLLLTTRGLVHDLALSFGCIRYIILAGTAARMNDYTLEILLRDLGITTRIVQVVAHSTSGSKA